MNGATRSKSEILALIFFIVTAASVRMELLRDGSGSALRERGSIRLVVNEDALAIQSFLSVSL